MRNDDSLSATNEKDYGLLIPTENEAKAMLSQVSDVDGSVGIIKPMSYDINLAVDKGLSDSHQGFGEEYLKIQAFYRKTLEQHLLDLLDLKHYDDILTENELRFIPLADDDMSFYQKYSTLDLKFIYLRNNLPIERLSKEDLDTIRFFMNETKSDISELNRLVGITYQGLILAHDDLESDVPVSYSNGGRNIAHNNALVLEIGHATEYDENDNFADAANETKKGQFIRNDFIPLMEKELSEKLDIGVKVFYTKV